MNERARGKHSSTVLYESYATCIKKLLGIRIEMLRMSKLVINKICPIIILQLHPQKISKFVVD